MDLAEEAFLAQRARNEEKALLLFLKALALEEKAANLLPLNEEAEPTRSILYRSAASLAYNARDYEQAERLVARGLAGYPPEEIREELKNLYEDINFQRHLKSKGTILDRKQWMLTIAGDAVKYGGTSADLLMTRVDRISSMFYRTVERMLKIPYRTGGGVSKKIKDDYGLFINALSPRSFAVSFQLGMPEPQMDLPLAVQPVEKSVDADEVIDEMMDCLALFEADDSETLKAQIGDESYFENFVGLAKEIAPDGKNVNLVGFTTVRNGVDTPVALRKKRKNRKIAPKERPEAEEQEGFFQLSGRLVRAYSPDHEKYGTVSLLQKETGEKIKIYVPLSIMKDVVQPYYEEFVTIQGYMEKKKRYYEEIALADEE
ncbi:hypothetical protein FIM25_16645 [Desulfobotulus mexicanus]|uniref:Uncharacterized protein n=2 Tax=Desulfobotulus mexicanus TaxID=2586642 RepID=A0A5S5MBX4_9BACT|nr:hypothetical protein FIM25_16645 [Desulfobotulus mexicanus]